MKYQLNLKFKFDGRLPQDVDQLKSDFKEAQAELKQELAAMLALAKEQKQ